MTESQITAQIEETATETVADQIAEETQAFEEAFEAATAETVAETTEETEMTNAVEETTAETQTEEIATTTEEPQKVDGRATNGRKSTYSDRKKKLAALLALRDGADAVAPDGTKAEKPASRHLEKDLEKMGLVKFEVQKIAGQKGRPKHVAVLSGQGKAVLASMLKKAQRDADKAAETQMAVGE